MREHLPDLRRLLHDNLRSGPEFGPGPLAPSPAKLKQAGLAGSDASCCGRKRVPAYRPSALTTNLHRVDDTPSGLLGDGGC